MVELSAAQGPALSTLAFLLLGASSHTWVPSAGNSPAPCSPGSHFLANSHLRRNSPLHLKHLCHPQPRDYSNRVEMSLKAKTSRFKSCTVTWACGLTVHGSRSVCVPHHGTTGVSPREALRMVSSTEQNAGCYHFICNTQSYQLTLSLSSACEQIKNI